MGDPVEESVQFADGHAAQKAGHQNGGAPGGGMAPGVQAEQEHGTDEERMLSGFGQGAFADLPVKEHGIRRRDQ